MFINTTEINTALSDLKKGIANYDAWVYFAINDLKQKFRRSVLGPFWITLNMCILIVTIGIVFSNLFNQNIWQTLPYIALGIMIWGFISTTLNESAVSLIEAGPFIRSIPLPICHHLFRVIMRNIIILGFNFTIYMLMVVANVLELGYTILLFVPSLLLLLITLTNISIIFAIISARYRDLPQIISNLLQIMFYFTPIFWTVDRFANNSKLITCNPFYYLIDILRSPLLGIVPSLNNYIICICMCLLTMIIALTLYSRTYSKIVYWV